MRILYIGDFIKGNGPSQVDKNLFVNQENVRKEQINANLKILKEIRKYEFIIISGLSTKGLVLLLFSKIFRKKNIYILHGSLKLENKYRKISKYRLFLEKYLIKFSSQIVCVSEMYSLKVKELYKDNKEKIKYINNGSIKFKKNIDNYKRERKILTFGGGRKEKGVLEVCMALDLLKKNNQTLIEKLIVIGEDGENTEKIKKYSFVEYLGFISHKNAIQKMLKTNYFIQNSYIESFGLGCIEAAMLGCKILLSKEIPVAKILKIDAKFICDNLDIKDISQKIQILEKDKQKINISNIDSWEIVTQKYLDLIKEII